MGMDGLRWDNENVNVMFIFDNQDDNVQVEMTEEDMQRFIESISHASRGNMLHVFSEGGKPQYILNMNRVKVIFFR